jgi:hypothetical protein
MYIYGFGAVVSQKWVACNVQDPSISRSIPVVEFTSCWAFFGKEGRLCFALRQELRN